MNGAYQVTRYTPDLASAWDEFVRLSRNGTFLFERAYMDYHADRFTDGSLMIWRDGTLAAVMPAHAAEDALVSHGGLTYGGLIIGDAMRTPGVTQILALILSHLQNRGISKLIYKTVPTIYHRTPSEEDRYALFLANARLYRRDVLTVVPSKGRANFQERRKRAIRKAASGGVTTDRSDLWKDFWAVLQGRLDERYGVQPVHSLAEIRLLAGRFPNNIKLFTALAEGHVVAGVVIFESQQVAHAQYIAASDDGRESGALDLLFDFLLKRYADKPWFDFGISNENDGRRLNVGLVEHKEGFGGAPITHDFYSVDVIDENISALRKALEP